MNALLTLACITLCFLCINAVYHNRDVIETFIVCLVSFFFLYVMTGAILFWINIFSITGALFFTLLLSVLWYVYLYHYKKMTFSYSFHLKESIGCMVIIAISLPFIWNKFGFYGMGQDEGVYQTRAILMINGYTSDMFRFDEYDNLSDEQKIAYAESAHGLLSTGQDLEEYITNIGDAYADDVTGQFHGIPLFSSLLALYGSIFGVSRMLDIQTVFYVCMIFLIYYILARLRVKRAVQLAGTFIMSCSPLVLWLAKTSLVEVFLAVITVSFLYLMVDKEYEHLRVFSCIPIVVYSFYHITIFVMLPMYLVIYYGLYFMTMKRKYLIDSAIIVVSYYLGYLMMKKISAKYTYSNYKNVYVGPIDSTNLTFWITIAVLVVLVFTAAFWFIRLRSNNVIKYILVGGAWLVIVLSLVVVGYVFIKSKRKITYMTLYTYIISSGFILLFIILGQLLVKPKYMVKSSINYVLSAVFIYSVLVYSAFLKNQIVYYYYYARYLVPNIPVIILLGSRIMNGLSGLSIWKQFKIRRWLPVMLCLVVFCVMYPYNAVIATENDETQLSYSNLVEVTSLFKEGDAVIISEDLTLTLKLPVKCMSGADTFTDATNMEELISELKGHYNNIYYLTTSYSGTSAYDFENIYTIQNYAAMNVMRDYDKGYSGIVIPFSLMFTETRQNISVYQVE